MSHYTTDVRAGMRGNGAAAEESIGDLMTRLVHETRDLAKLEIARVRADAKKTVGKGLGTGVAVGVVAVMAFYGALALTAAGILGFGALLGYFWGALITAGIWFLLGAAGAGVARAMVRSKVEEKMEHIPSPDVPELEPHARHRLEAASATHHQGVRH